VLTEFVGHLRDGLDAGVFSGVFGNPTCSQVMDAPMPTGRTVPTA